MHLAIGHGLGRVKAALHIEHEGGGNHQHREQGDEIDAQIGGDAVRLAITRRVDVLHGGAGEFQNAQNADDPQQAQDLGGPDRGEVQEHEVGGKDRQQIDHAPEAGDILDLVFRGVDIEYIIQREKHDREPFEGRELRTIFRPHRVHRLQRDRHAGNVDQHIDQPGPDLEGLVICVMDQAMDKSRMRIFLRVMLQHVASILRD